MQNTTLHNCCEGISVETPTGIHNRPNLTAVAYRVGNYHQFRESLFAKLSTAQHAALRQLTTRDEGDFTLALLDAWAVVSDVLTFYQERIIQESYLETATELRSVLELARLIGYELRPGVAASSYVAFTLDENSLAASQALVSGHTIVKKESPLITIAVGTKIQSIPESGESPQTFETVQAIEAKAEWNAIKPRKHQPQEDVLNQSIIVLQDTNHNINKGDILLLNKKSLKQVRKVSINTLKATTYLEVEANAEFLNFSPHEPSFVKKLRAIFSSQNEGIGNSNQKTAWNENQINKLLQVKCSAEDFYIIMQENGWSAMEIQESVAEELAEKTIMNEDVQVFRKKAFPFGYNAGKRLEHNIAKPINLSPPNSAVSVNGVQTTPVFTEWKVQNIEDTNKIEKGTEIEAADKIYLDTTYQEIVPHSYIAIQKSDIDLEKLNKTNIYAVKFIETQSRNAYGISAKTSLLKISPLESRTPSPSPWWNLVYTYIYSATDDTEGTIEPIRNNFSTIKDITVHAQSEPLPLAKAPITETVKGNTIWLSKLHLGLKRGLPIILTGERADLKGTQASELRFLKEVYIIKGYTVLELNGNLDHEYIRETVTINANVAQVTHGESLSEILGSGNASSIFQKFVLKQPPLTFVSAATSSGTASTLKVSVNDILWKEVPSLYNQAANEHIYITRQNDLGQTTVIFGDGIHGARLPTGTQNVRATYRKGIGTGGILQANQLSQLLTRPLGVKAVTNPIPATGAQDREQLADARSNANLTIFTLDRIVSLQDYEDFARAFAGIAKASATWIWNNSKRQVHITIAGHNGAAVEENSELYSNLLTAIQNSGIPNVPIRINSYHSSFFKLSANIKVHSDYIEKNVLTAVKQALKAHFSFEKRQFGQSVALSEVMAVMQKIVGVVFIDIDDLYEGNTADRKDIIPAKSKLDTVTATILTIDSRSLILNAL